MRRFNDIAELTALLGQPYSGEVGGTPMGRHRADVVTAELEKPTPADSTAPQTDYYRWDCMRLLAELDRSTFEVLGAAATTRLPQYARAVQELTVLSSCAAIRHHDGSWAMFQVCCLHERMLDVPRTNP
jgi:hypothetical protein